MKIIANDAVYVQKNDLFILNRTYLSMPVSIFMKIFDNDIAINDSNRFEFVRFEETAEIEYFKNLDWIIDYNLVKDLSEKELMVMGENISEQKNEIAHRYNAMSEEDKKINIQMFDECELLDFKMYSLRDIIWFRQGKIRFILPKGVEYPNDMRKGNFLRRILKK